MSPFNYAKTERSRDNGVVPSTEKPFSRPDMIRNSGGGYAFQISALKQFERFLILGSSSPTYYASSKKITENNIAIAKELIQKDPESYINAIVDVLSENRAPKLDPALFAYALFFKYAEPKWKYEASLKSNTILRTFTHLATFLGYLTQFHGYGRSVRRIMTQWYTDKSPEKVLFQYTKYANRNGWTHKDVVHLAHIKPNSEGLDMLFKHMFNKIKDSHLAESFPQYDSDIKLREADTSKKVVDLIKLNDMIQWEQIPTQFLKDSKVWEALLPNMGLTALVRNLGRMTQCGVFKAGFCPNTKIAVSRMTSENEIRRSRVHPIQFLSAWSTYRSGKSYMGSLSWTPQARIVAALESAYCKAFINCESTGKNYYIGVDTSGSMTFGTIAGIPGLRPIEAAACIAFERVKKEEWTEVVSFSSRLTRIGLSEADSLEETIKKVYKGDISCTDPGLLIQDALNSRLPVDVFIMVTDNEVNHGNHPFMLLKEFRKRVNPEAKLVSIGLTATNVSIADPKDPGMLDIVGFDSATPRIISAFSKGEL